MLDGKAGKVILIGAGPGDPELLTMKAHRAIQTADIVVHDRLVSPEIMAVVPSTTRRVDVGKMPRYHSVPQDSINELLIDLARQGLIVARLKGGDPLIFGRGGEEAVELRRAGIEVCCIPGITAAQGVAAATGIPLTHRGLATGVRYVTGHRAKDAALDLDWHSLASEQTTLVVYMGVATIAEISFELQRHGMCGSIPVLAVANVTMPRETRLISTLDCIARDISLADLTSPVLFVIGHVVALYNGEGPSLASILAVERRQVDVHA